MSWELLLGLWGTLLSTLLALERLFKDRPAIEIKKGNETHGPFIISIKNRFNNDIIVRRMTNRNRSVPLTATNSCSIESAIRISINELENGNLNHIIPPLQQIEYSFDLKENGPDEDAKDTEFIRHNENSAILILHWSDFVPRIIPRLPCIIRLSPKRLRSLRNSVR